jgi:hypothetical protein
MRELYASSNGDRWHLLVDASTGYAFVRHTANAASGGHVVDFSVSAFLVEGRDGPEHQALWSLLRDIAESTSSSR